MTWGSYDLGIGPAPCSVCRSDGMPGFLVPTGLSPPSGGDVKEGEERIRQREESEKATDEE